MDRIIKFTLNSPTFDWKDLQSNFHPEPDDLAYVYSVVPRGSVMHELLVKKIQREMRTTKRINYPTLIRLISTAIYAW